MSTVTESAVERLDLQVKVNKPGACERHVVVVVPRKDVDRYFKKAFDELGPKAEMPGFRVGKAPRKLLESRFREQITEQVKSSLVMDSLQQVTEGGDFSAISEPDMDYGAVQIPKDGDFTFEFKIEVRPEFDTPNWKGLSLTRPVHVITDKDVDEQLSKTLTRFSEGEPVDGEAKAGDTLLLNIDFTYEGKLLSVIEEEKIVLRNKLSLADAVIEDFDKLMVGVREGETRSTKVKISNSTFNEEFRGKEVDAGIEVIEIRRLSVDDLRAAVLEELGFDDVPELREFVRSELDKQQTYYQQQEIRKQVTAVLTKDAQWEMPSEMVNRQTNRELQRQALELQRSGFSADDVKSYLNVGRRNAREMTIAALREHFVLEKIAEDLKIEPTSEDYDAEVDLIAENSSSNPRKVRARLEKTGQMDALRNQIIERKVVEMVTAEAKLTDKEDSSFLRKMPEESAIEFVIAPLDSDIPEAKYDNKSTDGQPEGATVKLQP
ncbi:MAG: trigger factor [Pirellulaceae bacterium]|nr:trigger factor [Pirellulaceae bacterium]